MAPSGDGSENPLLIGQSRQGPIGLIRHRLDQNRLSDSQRRMRLHGRAAELALGVAAVLIPFLVVGSISQALRPINTTEPPSGT